MVSEHVMSAHSSFKTMVHAPTVEPSSATACEMLKALSSLHQSLGLGRGVRGTVSFGPAVTLATAVAVGVATTEDEGAAEVTSASATAESLGSGDAPSDDSREEQAVPTGATTAMRTRSMKGDVRDYVAITADTYFYAGVSQPVVLLFETAKLAMRRPASGEAVAGAMTELRPIPLVYVDRAPAFGRMLWGGVNLIGDATPDLVVSAPGANVNGDGIGAVFVFAGGELREGPNGAAMTIVGDERERASFGADLAVCRAGPGSAASIVVGAPLSFRHGTANGTAFVTNPP